MNKLFKIYAKILALINNFHKATPEDRSNLIEIIEGILQAYDDRKFNDLIAGLMDMNKIQSKIYPEEFHPTYIDFFLDINMWGWIIEKSSKNYQVVDTDWGGSKYIVEDLRERLTNNEIFAENE